MVNNERKGINMNSTKGKKIGIVMRVIIFLVTPHFIGSFVNFIGHELTPVYLVGCLVFFFLFIVIWILRAIFIWFFDDTGEKDPWQWGWFMNDDN